MLIGSSIVTTLFIPAEAFQPGGEAYGRALAYLAHEHLGRAFGTLYDISTVAILWFAGASALVGLINLVPQFLPRYGMAPDWARATRPLVMVFVSITFLVTVLFKADVNAQAAAYATGVLVLMGSAALAVTIAALRGSTRGMATPCSRSFCLHHDREHRRAPGGDQDCRDVHRVNRGQLAHFACPAIDGAARARGESR